MSILASLLHSCSLAPISVLDLSCDSQCENVYITISIPDRGVLTTVLNTRDVIWAQLASVEGVKFSFLSGDTSSDLVASNGNEIMSVDLATRSYRTLYSHTAPVFYPAKTENLLYFSESKVAAPGLKNPHQGRILWKLDTNSGALTHGLQPWTAYQIGRPFIVKSEWLYLDLILLSKATKSDSQTERGLQNALNRQSAYKLNVRDAFSGQVSLESMLNGQLFSGQQKAEQISVDRNGYYLAYYTLSSTPSSWVVHDLRTNASNMTISSNGNDRLVISPDGGAYAYVAGHGDSLRVSIGDLHGGAPILNLSLSPSEIEPITLERKEQ